MKLVFLGDIFFTRRISGNIKGGLLSLLKTSFVIGNLEAPFCNKGTPMEKFSNLKISTSLASELKELGVNAVSLANNHIMDYGVEGLESTIESLSRLEIGWFGAGKNINEALAPLEVDVGGSRVCLVGITTVFVPQARAADNRPGVAGMRMDTLVILSSREILEEPGAPYIVKARLYDEDVKILKEKISHARARCNLLVAVVHWGVGALPYSTVVLDYMRELGRLLVDCGVDLVVGGHPHILLPIEKYNGRFIAYSLGNFVFTEKVPLELSPTGGLIEFDLEPSNNAVEVRSLRLTPLCLDEYGIPHECENPLQVPEVLLALNQSRKWGCRCSIEGNHVVVE